MEVSKPTTVVTLGTEDRVGMSLDDLIKQQRKAAKSTKKPKTKPSAAGKQRAEAGVKSKTAKGTTLAAKATGAGKANRKARLDQRRGLNATGKPTAQAMKTEVAKQSTKQKKQAAAAKGQKQVRPKVRNAKAKQPPAPGGLKIAFNTKQSAAQDRVVRQQVAAVMAKQPTRNQKAGGAPQRAVIPKAGRGAGRR